MHFPTKFLQKRPPPTFSMVHLLHRLYGVDAPAPRQSRPKSSKKAQADSLMGPTVSTAIGSTLNWLMLTLRSADPRIWPVYEMLPTLSLILDPARISRRTNRWLSHPRSTTCYLQTGISARPSGLLLSRRAGPATSIGLVAAVAVVCR